MSLGLRQGVKLEEIHWITEFAQARAWGLLDGALYTLISLSVFAAAGWISRATIAARYALRTRMSIGILLVMGFTLAAICIGVPANWAVAASGFASITFIFVALRGLAKLGISNAFARTSEGISAERSLKLVRKEIAFLGIGASKLTSSEEFNSALKRCKTEGQPARFLLADPKNPELTRLAAQNNKNDTAYKSRVEQSIKEIFHHGIKIGGKFEVRLYQLDNEKSLSKFRMMFIDDRFCLLSHVVWNESEGGDNSQIFISRTKSNSEQGLYTAYKEFFEDLWKANSSRVVTQEMIDDGLVD